MFAFWDILVWVWLNKLCMGPQHTHIHPQKQDATMFPSILSFISFPSCSLLPLPSISLSARHSCHPLPSAVNVFASLRHYLWTHPLEHEHLRRRAATKHTALVSKSGAKATNFQIFYLFTNVNCGVVSIMRNTVIKWHKLSPKILSMVLKPQTSKSVDQFKLFAVF